ncbi:6-hydroxymethylpterin diphosphokinase MptE-like protein [Alteromonas sp. H39]|uniref:motility associated factor glycosyltransferase family protein n=1 Tax=Alteromonas sp. H39 TaxID=3389876 RepID=UPI0039DF89B5
MIESIQLHLSDDEDYQVSLEKKLSELISRQFRKNLIAFRSYMPSVATLLNGITSSNLSVFCNKHGEANVVDYGQGRVFYGTHPQKEVLQQYHDFLAHPLRFSVSDKGSELGTEHSLTDSPLMSYFCDGLPTRVSVMVVLGVGLGYHLEHILKSGKVDHLIVYEPEPQLFRCSAFVLAWNELLKLAQSAKTSIYLQIGNTGESLRSDLRELAENVSFDDVYLYRHYNTSTFSYIVYDLAINGLQLKENTDSGSKLLGLKNHFLPRWSGGLKLNKWQDVTPTLRYKKNLQAFSKYVPDVYEQFKSYEPESWLPVQEGEAINLVSRRLLTPWYASDPVETCRQQFESFCQHPRKDGVVLGYDGDKLKHYLHYQFVNKSEEILDDVHEKQQSLPSRIKSLIMFGLGSGYDLKIISEERTIEKLFICEPNRDFFYASLFAIDWASLLEKVDEEGGRIYLNVGDDGSHLFTDLLNQFHSIGPYVLAQTYFYQGYFDDRLSNAIAQLREQLQVVIAMGEYFDHAYFGISHTLESIRRKHKFLQSSKITQLNERLCETPVFIVGNGPSLDSSLETLRENQDKAIIVSCGTAIQVLYRHGIQPDFHAEIEQNRSTFDWAKSVYADEFLKKIDLISCNGFHPDTSELYKDIYLVFKEGESSTVSSLAVVEQDRFATLKYAFPTVSNFAVNTVMAWGSKQVYLFGVDLGFKDPKKHHSKDSGYYNDDGEEVYDYSEKNNVSLRVPGNFSDLVNTKYEFKVAGTSLERALAVYRPECYNTSDGARIKGTVPLPLDMVLLTNSADHKQQTLQALREELYVEIPPESYFARYENRYSRQQLSDDLSALEQSIQQPFESSEQAEQSIESQKKLMFDSYQSHKSLLFYYLYGSMNYFHAALSKVLGAGLDEEQCVEACEKIRAHWETSFSMMHKQMLLPELAFDVSTAISQRRYYTSLKQSLDGFSVTVVTDSVSFREALKGFIAENDISLNVRWVEPRFVKHHTDTESQVIVYLAHASHGELEDLLTKLARKALVISNEKSSEIVSITAGFDCPCLWLGGNIFTDNAILQANDFFRVSIALSFLTVAERYSLILPKVYVNEGIEEPYVLPDWIYNEYDHIYDANIAIAFSKMSLSNKETLLPNGHRSMRIFERPGWHKLTLERFGPDYLAEYRDFQCAKRPYLLEK